MAENTKIEWAHHTFNPWIGCTKVSPACDHCYAEKERASTALGVKWGANMPRHRTGESNWKTPERWNAAAERRGVRESVFCASLSDWADNAVPGQWRLDLAGVIRRTPWLDWLLLTKRIGNAAAMLAEMFPDGVPDNVWIGVTICNQEEADRDIPKLLAVPAAKRFLSMEPLLGPVDLRGISHGDGEIDALRPGTWEDAIEQWRGTSETWEEDFEDWYNITIPGDGLSGPMHVGIDWVIVGGESGPNARPMHPDWARSLRDQCQAAGVPFLFKQWGEWTPGENVERERGTVDTAVHFGGEWHTSRLNLATDDGHIDDQPDLYRVGKKAAGRHLDGIEHNGFPS